MNSDAEKWVKLCEQMGAYKAALIETERIPFDPSLRQYCVENKCGAYGKNYGCPPDAGTPEEVMEKAHSFRWALVFQSVGKLADSYDQEGMAAAGTVHGKIAERIRAEVRKEKASYIELSAGGCHLCTPCAKVTGEPCRFPDRASISVSAYCINVTRLAARCGMKYNNGADTVTYFGLFLFS